ncbi:DEKNAAC100553 [Brettanomyces naardenensis]|uniref:Peroxidase n=1 Tax=Brettanomyces naardenensis TaxID=13370 RepID=A0A448YEY1_BRENA|nr:DEKNAAC100553 [Brettanomyces naardenensis]
MSSIANPFFRTASRTFVYSKASFRGLAYGSVALAAAAAVYYGNNKQPGKGPSNFGTKAFLGGLFGTAEYEKNTREASVDVKPFEDYQKVYNDIALRIREHDEWDDGSYAPILVRLAWHNSGSYDQHDHSATKGGTYAGTMRFEKEQKDPENAGLTAAMKFLAPIKEKYPFLSEGDLWTLGGVVGIQEMEGPKIAWRPGREDQGEEAIPPYHRLPDAAQTTGDYVRSVFHERLGFSDKEMVCLIGVGHAIGRCHTYSSGFDGPWTFSPTTVTNDFFENLLEEDWEFKKWNGKKQYVDAKTKSIMMLPTDMVLKTDPKFRKYVEEYAKDSDKALKDFSVVFSKLLERGVKFPSSTKPMLFQTLDEQGIDDE